MEIRKSVPGNALYMSSVVYSKAHPREKVIHDEALDRADFITVYTRLVIFIAYKLIV